MKVNRIVFVNRAPFGNLDIDFSDNQVISLTGINGSGKTTILSYIVDAFHEIARKAYQNEFSGVKKGMLYRISSELYNVLGTEHSVVYISFDIGDKEVYYFDFLGEINEDRFNELLSPICGNSDIFNWPIQFGAIRNQFERGAHYAKYVTIDENDARKVFSNNLLTYFPSYRYEQPGFLNDVFRMKITYKYESDLAGYLTNPIEVTSDLPQIANWMMDVVLDNKIGGQKELLITIQKLTSSILSYKHKKSVRIGIGPRNMGGARIQIVDTHTGLQIYPSIFSISAGEASLLCIFGELIRQSDRIGKNISEVNGIVLVDEIDKHLHIKLQKEVIPMLVQMFPKIQFIFSTHSTFVNIGLTDSLANACRVLDLDNGGIECEANMNDAFREAYDVMIKENERYMHFYAELSNRIKAATKPVVYLEGRTDEKYFDRAWELFGNTGIDIDFQWIGHMDSKGNESFTGSGSLNQGMQFIRGRNPKVLQFFLFDCDTKKVESDEDNIVVMTMPLYNNHRVMNKGIENALELDGIDLDPFYDVHETSGDYGKVVTTKELNKMRMCDYICGLDENLQMKILRNLKGVIDKIIARVEKTRV